MSLIVVIFISKIIIDVFFDKTSKNSIGRSSLDQDRYMRLKETSRGPNQKNRQKSDPRVRFVAQKWQLTRANLDYIDNSQQDEKHPFSPASSSMLSSNFASSFSIPNIGIQNLAAQRDT